MTPQQIEALKLALEFIERVNKDGWILADFEPEMYATITAIKEALAEHAMQETQRIGQEIEQEPVAWISTSPARMIHWTSDKPAYGDDWIPLYTKEQL